MLQRLIRSFYVRRQFEQVRKEYLQTLSEIEGEMIIEPIVVEKKEIIEEKSAEGNFQLMKNKSIR